MRKTIVIIVSSIIVLITISSFNINSIESTKTNLANLITSTISPISTKTEANAGIPNSTPEPEKIILPDADRLNDIGLSINREFSTRNTNYYFSPYSIYEILNQTGVLSVGETKNEIDKFTGIDNSELLNQTKNYYSLFSVWYAKGISINGDFVNSIGINMKEYSGKNVDELISWVEQKIGHKPTIPARSLFAPESEIAFAVIDRFSISDFLQGDGHVVSGEFSQMDGINMRIDYSCVNSEISVSNDNKIRFISIPDNNAESILIIIQPMNPYDTYNLLPSLSMDFVVGGVSEEYEYQSICVPQGKYYSESDFTDPLIAYGVRRMFFPDVAEMTRLSRSDSVYVSGIYNFSVSEFNIPGEKVISATLPTETIWIDSPFLYFVIDQEFKKIIGIGRYHSQNW